MHISLSSRSPIQPLLKEFLIVNIVGSSNRPLLTLRFALSNFAILLDGFFDLQGDIISCIVVRCEVSLFILAIIQFFLVFNCLQIYFGQVGVALRGVVFRPFEGLDEWVLMGFAQRRDILNE